MPWGLSKKYVTLVCSLYYVQFNLIWMYTDKLCVLTFVTYFLIKEASKQLLIYQGRQQLSNGIGISNKVFVDGSGLSTSIIIALLWLAELHFDLS